MASSTVGWLGLYSDVFKNRRNEQYVFAGGVQLVQNADADADADADRPSWDMLAAHGVLPSHLVFEYFQH
jgi:hypothetical protein